MQVFRLLPYSSENRDIFDHRNMFDIKTWLSKVNELDRCQRAGDPWPS